MELNWKPQNRPKYIWKFSAMIKKASQIIGAKMDVLGNSTEQLNSQEAGCTEARRSEETLYRAGKRGFAGWCCTSERAHGVDAKRSWRLEPTAGVTSSFLPSSSLLGEASWWRRERRLQSPSTSMTEQSKSRRVWSWAWWPANTETLGSLHALSRSCIERKVWGQMKA